MARSQFLYVFLELIYILWLSCILWGCFSLYLWFLFWCGNRENICKNVLIAVDIGASMFIPTFNPVAIPAKKELTVYIFLALQLRKHSPWVIDSPTQLPHSFYKGIANAAQDWHWRTPKISWRTQSPRSAKCLLIETCFALLYLLFLELVMTFFILTFYYKLINTPKNYE